jgi:hypothetical protein
MPTFVTEGKTSFKTIAVLGQSDVVADSGLDTLTLAAGSDITLTTNATTDTVTIAYSGEGGGEGGDNVTLATVSGNYLSLSGQEITAGTVPVSLGGTGTTSVGAARTALGVDAAGTDNSTNVTLATISSNYLSLSGQEITAGTVPVSLGGTGATSVGAARTALGVDAAGTDNSTNVTLATVSSNYLSLSGQEITAGTVPVSLSGTGQTSYTDGQLLIGNSSGNTLSKSTLTQGSGISITNGNGSITIESTVTDTNTTYTASEGGGLTLSGTGFSIDTSADVRFNSLGVGTAASGTTGEIRATNDITAFYSSDKRLKTNIQPIQDPLTKLQKIGGYTFDWIPKEGIHSHTGNDIGVIAQEIEEVLPEITTTRDNGYKAVRYEKLTAYLIECVKEQQTHIQQLEDRLVNLEKKD